MPILPNNPCTTNSFYYSFNLDWGNPVSYKESWIEYRKELDRLEQNEANSKTIQHLRNILIQYWNKLTPKEQREIANEYS